MNFDTSPSLLQQDRTAIPESKNEKLVQKISSMILKTLLDDPNFKQKNPEFVPLNLLNQLNSTLGSNLEKQGFVILTLGYNEIHPDYKTISLESVLDNLGLVWKPKFKSVFSIDEGGLKSISEKDLLAAQFNRLEQLPSNHPKILDQNINTRGQFNLEDLNKLSKINLAKRKEKLAQFPMQDGKLLQPQQEYLDRNKTPTEGIRVRYQSIKNTLDQNGQPFSTTKVEFGSDVNFAYHEIIHVILWYLKEHFPNLKVTPYSEYSNEVLALTLEFFLFGHVRFLSPNKRIRTKKEFVWTLYMQSKTFTGISLDEFRQYLARPLIDLVNTMLKFLSTSSKENAGLLQDLKHYIQDYWAWYEVQADLELASMKIEDLSKKPLNVRRFSKNSHWKNNSKFDFGRKQTFAISDLANTNQDELRASLQENGFPAFNLTIGMLGIIPDENTVPNNLVLKLNQAIIDFDQVILDLRVDKF
ncbi:MAG: hypothetical protein OHK0017_01360 [Patescibacteria group bacterium]